MSSRNIRKFVGGNVLPPPDDDESDYEPLYANKAASKSTNKFDGLCGSTSESEEEPPPEPEKESEEETKPPSTSNRKKNKSKKRRLKKKGGGGTTIEMDEIEKSLQEVNELLGAPPPAPEPVAEEAKSIEDIIFGVDTKFLNPSYELRKLLGPDLEEEARNRRSRRPQYTKRGLVLNVDMNFQKVGLCMSKANTKQPPDGCNHFVIEHEYSYQKRHRILLQILLAARDDFPDLNANDAVANMHVEEILQVTEILFAMEEYERAKKLLEKSVAYLQFISHPQFRMTDRNNRLEYRFLENRVYHVAFLKYIYVLTNSACHRTALELSKVLLNLDPSDPLALIILMDMLALRAREHKWLVELVDYWKTVRDADYMFNLLYSYALAKFHVIKKSKGDMTEADEALKFAMTRFPTVVPELFKVTNNKNATIEACEMFKDKQDMSRSMKSLWNDLLKYYTLFTASKWREPDVWAWFSRNAIAMTTIYQNDEEIQKQVKQFASLRTAFLRCLPQQVVRHFQVIKFMNNFIFDEIIFTMRPGVASYNPEPWPTEDINRYGYVFTRARPQVSERTFGIFGDFVRSLAPEFAAIQELLGQQAEQQDEGGDPDPQPPREGDNVMDDLFQVMRQHLLLMGGPPPDYTQHVDEDNRWDLVFPDD